MKSLRIFMLGFCIGSGFILMLLGLEALTMRNMTYPEYFLVCIIIAAGLIIVAQKAIK